ncbi:MULTISPECIES: tetratricopeptide repeat protein [Pseudanabaena]|uniref:Tetratricopeptide TPR_1 repeat-containing protein n=2 Tax=Pseudanabaena TaxID=1152 RepID=L8N6Z4_9CYAN|nr:MULTISPECIES: tetratricopeptide repeat protein [Pseudanabaena]ELS34874.1 Tetratricopeptide TPR_1 repeat-containing protein [Pseudanabaena biceps PCC 7429]MDG3492993.1 tetratricopeptide repeat protein [Pseudanabaena catenata USMAC16]
MKAVCIYAQDNKNYYEKFLLKHLNYSINSQGIEITPHEHCNTSNFNSSSFKKNINEADIVFLLVSIESLNISSWKQYADLAVKRQKKSSPFRVVPIRIDNALWDNSSFEYLKSLPRDKNGNSIAIEDRSWKNRKEAFESIAKDIKELCEEIKKLIDLQESKRLEKERKNAEEKFMPHQQMQINLSEQKDSKAEIFIAIVIVSIFLLIGNFIKPNNSNSNSCSSKVKPETYFKDGLEKEEKGSKKEKQEKEEYLYKAVEQYTCAIQIQPNYYEAYVKRGKIYLNQKDYELAIKDYDKAISLNPEDPFNYYNRGEAYYGKNG